MTKSKAKYVKKLSLEKVLKKGPAGFNYIKQQTGLTRTDAIKEIKKLKKNGVHVENYLNAKYNPQFYINTNPTNIVNNVDLGLKEGNYTIGFESDLHMGDKAFREDAHNKAYDQYEDAGVIAVLDAGDLTTGVNVYRGQQAELSYHTLDDQIQYVIDSHPSISGVKKHVIGGNHDYDSLKSCGINPLTVIQSKREDIEFIGWSDAKINIGGGVTFELCHYKGSMAWCVDKETEVFTKKGFKLFKNLNKKDILLTLNKKGFMEWKIPKKILSFDFNGELIHFKGESFDILSTPNHRHLVRKQGRKGRNRDTNWNTMTSEELESKWVSQKFRFKRNGLWKGKEPKKLIIKGIKKSGYNLKDFIIDNIEKFFEFLGWFVSEGHTVAPGRIFITQTKSKNWKDIINSYEEIGLKKPIYVGDKFVSNNKRLKLWIDENCGKGARNKKVPEMVKESTPELINKFLISLCRGDGWFYKNKPIGYCTSSKRLADDVIELLLKTGRAGTIRYRKEREVYEISISNIKCLEPTINFKPERVKYKDKVYCVEIPNETFLIKRNGKTMWTKNSLGYRAQKFLRDCDASSMPDILGLGHKHVAMYANIQGVHSLEGGTFQGQNNFTKERGLHGSVCSWIIEYTIEAGKIIKFRPELLVF